MHSTFNEINAHGDSLQDFGGMNITRRAARRREEKGIVTDRVQFLTGRYAHAMAKPWLLGLVCLFWAGLGARAQSDEGWYTQGDFVPTHRIAVTVSNPLSIELKDQPVAINRTALPVQNIPVRSIAVIDPGLPENPEPTQAELRELGGYVIGKETHGHALETQVDDLDQDGVWDQIFFLTDLKPRETRKFYIYVDPHERGLYPFEVFAELGDYGRHIVPLFESKVMGWKLWYPGDLDLHGKRNPMLTAYYELSTNRSGYFMPDSMGTDIMTVRNTFGAGGMCLFEDPSDPENPVRAFYSPYKDQGPIKDTRYAFDIICNGPLRSIVKVTTTNWNSGQGSYAYEQYYTVIAHKSWCKVDVRFTKFLPPNSDVMFGAGIRKIMKEYKSVQDPGMVISMGKDIPARIPDEDIGTPVLNVGWEGIALVVNKKYHPKYHDMKNYRGNHVFEIPRTPDLKFEYMVLGGWSFGTVNNDEKSFTDYVRTEQLKYDNPPAIQVGAYEIKGK
jgi:hypothetical protein